MKAKRIIRFVVSLLAGVVVGMVGQHLGVDYTTGLVVACVSAGVTFESVSNALGL